MKKKQTKKDKWFVAVRGSYLPASKQGWLTYIPYIGYCLLVPYIAFMENSSVAYQIFVTISNWLLATFILTTIARQNC
jgi:hypothetical protein